MTTYPKFIAVRNKNRLYRIETKDLNAVVADSYYVTFKTENYQHFTCSKLLKEVQLMLPPPYICKG
jgi:DNA-binding LytR/AlgR family response regulator